MTMTHCVPLLRAGVAALSVLVAGCGTTPGNPSLNSVHQPVVERVTHTLDLTAPGGVLAAGEMARLATWFSSLDLGYGDRVSIAGDPRQASDIAALVTGQGAQLSLDGGAPVASPAAGTIRVSVLRSRATVPNCPGWSATSTVQFNNATSAGFGCSVNGNLAAMVADPQHLLEGADGTGLTSVMTATKAISTYRGMEPTGANGLPVISSRGGEGE